MSERVNGASRDPIDSTLRAIGERLPGRDGPRNEILDELRDGLLEAVERNVKRGLGHDQAVQLALRQFGDAPTLAAAFLPELAAARARRVVLALFVTGPIVAALWASAARSRGSGPERGLFDSGAIHLAAALLIAAAICCGIWTILASDRITRSLRLAPQAPLFAAAATGGLAVIADLALLSTLSVPLASFPGAIHQVALGAAILASGTRLILTSRASWSCLTMSTSPDFLHRC